MTQVLKTLPISLIIHIDHSRCIAEITACERSLPFTPTPQHQTWMSINSKQPSKKTSLFDLQIILVQMFRKSKTCILCFLFRRFFVAFVIIISTSPSTSTMSNKYEVYRLLFVACSSLLLLCLKRTYWSCVLPWFCFIVIGTFPCIKFWWYKHHVCSCYFALKNGVMFRQTVIRQAR